MDLRQFGGTASRTFGNRAVLQVTITDAAFRRNTVPVRVALLAAGEVLSQPAEPSAVEGQGARLCDESSACPFQSFPLP